MIQRIQSLLLLFGAGLHVLLFFVIIWTAQVISDENTENKIIEMRICHAVEYSGDDKAVSSNSFHLLSSILNVVIISLALFTIFLYKNRVLQNKLCRLLILLNAGVIVFIIFSIDKLKETITASYTENLNYVQIAIPVIGLIIFFIAGRTIMKDEKKVRSVDRLR